MISREERKMWYRDKDRCLDRIQKAKTYEEKARLKRELSFIEYMINGKRKEKE